MKYLLTIFQILLFHSAFAQTKHISKIDQHAALTGYYSLDSLHDKLALRSYSDSEKVRSFFYWITQHISYDIAEYNKSGYVELKYPEMADSIEVNKLFQNDYAAYVLKRKKAICAGYAILFKLLCDRSKIECAIVHGYGKSGTTSTTQIVDVNHAWNAVKLNGRWHLLDVCWASGHCDNKVTRFTRKLNEYYYFTPPNLLIYDHYPSDIRWTILEKPLSKTEFENLPLLLARKNKVNFDSGSLNGILNIHVGDTVKFNLELLSGNVATGRYIPCIDEFDGRGNRIPRSKTLAGQTFQKDGNKLTYTYHIRSKKVSWLFLAYGSEYLAGYRLQID